MKNIILVVCSLLILSSCSTISTQQKQVARKNLSNLYKRAGIYSKPYGLDEYVQEHCHKKINEFYISGYENSESYNITKQLAPADFANIVIHGNARLFSNRVGFNVSNTLVFMTEYEGKTSLGVNWPQRFVCVVRVKDTIEYYYVLTEEGFKTTWGIDPAVPFAWAKK
jgi:hypothetical protein